MNWSHLALNIRGQMSRAGFAKTKVTAWKCNVFWTKRQDRKLALRVGDSKENTND
jgi:hypothetical protein